MNCAELAAALENQLLREREPHWVEEARRHAEHCPSCSRLLELHHVEEQLAGLCAVEPSSGFLEHVMTRIKSKEPHRIESARRISPEAFQKSMIVVGALILAAAYVVPAAGQPWLANLWPSIGLMRSGVLSAYFVAHPPWAMILAGVAALLVVFGMALPERPVSKHVARKSTIQ